MSGRKSEIWAHFTKVSQVQVRCKHCVCQLKYCNNTSNLWAHAKRHQIYKDNNVCNSNAGNNSHTGETQQNSAFDGSDSEGNNPGAPKRSKSTIQESFEKIQAFKGDGNRTAELHDALMFMVAKDHMPLLTPERPGFQYFLKQAVPLYNPPSRTTLTKMMEDKYAILASKIKTVIHNLDFYCLTADIWTNIQTTKSFFGLTLHYYTNGKNMQSVTIGVYPLDESHTAAYISSIILEICRNWNIDLNKVSIIVTDNGENMVKAARDTFGRNRHLPCFAHTINLLAFDVLGTRKVGGVAVDNVEGIPELINKVKNIITFFKRSVKASDALRKVQYERGKTEGTALRLMQAVNTRWNSTYLSLMRFLELSNEVGSILLSQSDSPNMVTGSELESLRRVCHLLAPLYQVTEELSAEKVPPASKVIPLLNLMQKKIESVDIPDTASIAAKMKNRLLSQFTLRFGNIEKVRPLALATLMDPRYKKLHFNDPIAMSDAITFLREAVRISSKNEQNIPSLDTSTPVTVTAQNSKYEGDLWDIHDDLVTANATSTQDDNGITIELRQFLNLPVVDRKQNPYVAWNTLKNQFPNIFKVAMKHLSIIATSVPSERLFSEAGLIATDMRNRLTGSHLSMLIFLSSIDESQWKC